MPERVDLPPDVIVSPDARRPSRVPPGQKETKHWPVLHEGAIPKIESSAWRLRIDGLVERPWECDWATFNAMPRAKVYCDLHCVTAWSKLNNLIEGPSTKTVLSHVKIMPHARYVLLHAYENNAGPWSTNLPLADFLGDDCLFATHHNGAPLIPAHGGPVRVVVPRLYLWKSAKWIHRVELLDEDQPGYWEQRGYHRRGDPWAEERFG